MKTSILLFAEDHRQMLKDPLRTVACFGTPRGGTSMVAGVMAGLGVPMGTNLPVNVEDPDFNPDQHDGDLESFVKTLPPVIEQRNASHSLWGWKFPLAAHYLEDIADRLRNLHFVVVMRDPVPATLRALNSGHKRPIEALLRRGQMQQRNIRLAQKMRCPSLIVSYERAIQNPAVFIDEVAFFLGLEAPEDRSALLEFMRPGRYKAPPSKL